MFSLVAMSPVENRKKNKTKTIDSLLLDIENGEILDRLEVEDLLPQQV